MRLNTIAPTAGSKRNARRVGRGIGSGFGKTCGKGHKGQKARSGGYHRINFEGGQMPIQRRLPKYGFSSRKAQLTAEVTLYEIAKIEATVVSLQSLKDADIISDNIQFVKVILSGEIKVAKTLQGLKCTKGAQAAIVDAGGKVED